MNTFKMPDLQIGDLVLWHDDPMGGSEPNMGWVVERPGRETISILVFTQSAGFVEKKSVRHREDPFWQSSEMAANWQRWGCFTEHPSTKLLKELKELLTRAKVEAARGAVEDGVRRGPGRPRKELSEPVSHESEAIA